MDPKAPGGDCKGSALGSQVYSRSAWHRDIWGIMYAWYFPENTSERNPTLRHNWISVIVWLDNPALENQKLLAVAIGRGGGGIYVGYHPTTMTESYMNGTHPQMAYSGTFTHDKYHTIDASSKTGDFQDLIHWSQLTDEARKGLDTADFGKIDGSPFDPVPFNDANFDEYGWFKPPTDI